MTRTVTENVEITTTCRYCRDYREPASGKVPGVEPNARVSSDQSAAMVLLNMVGLSRGMVADFCTGARGAKTLDWNAGNARFGHITGISNMVLVPGTARLAPKCSKRHERSSPQNVRTTHHLPCP